MSTHVRAHLEASDDAVGEDLGIDPFFTARVLSSLPSAPLGAGLSPRRRLSVLVGAYLLATAVGYGALRGLDSAVVDTVTTTAGAWFEPLDPAMPWLVAVALPLALLAIAIAARNGHTETA
ncbi:MAG: hypothetical protein IPH07_07130 [Deltaproteobacteria bacterium]|nr:hypothetical protein [Deltaproteobacteria bacterium]MBK8236508.1 hypothetical protein [Deltaproteobacteria bacterium]MBK8717868.1 hypothetical protein [Deltaproteobacteria bacterium]MBP7287771.1 hypothetical protein [Nannocystaceae bacterium]